MVGVWEYVEPSAPGHAIIAKQGSKYLGIFVNTLPEPYTEQTKVRAGADRTSSPPANLYSVAGAWEYSCTATSDKLRLTLSWLYSSYRPQDVGSQVVLVPFATDYLITHNISEACAIHGGGTSIEWLTSLANRYSEHNVILLTDAQGLEVPPGWTRQHRQRTTVIWIPDHDQDQPPELTSIAQRILIVRDENEIPNLIAISARAAIVSPF